MITADSATAEMKRLAAKYPKAREHLIGPRYSLVEYIRASDKQRARWDAERVEARRQAEAFDNELREWGASQAGDEP